MVSLLENGKDIMSRTRRDWLKACGNTKLETKEVSDPDRKYEHHVFLVYMHRNKINGKVYVGITHHVNPYKRWGYAGQKYTHCVKFLNAIHKYGFDNFEHIVLCRTSKERAIALEKALIAYYKRKGISYNLTDGGDGTDCFTEKNRIKLRERFRLNPPMKGRHQTPEAKTLISKALKARVYTKQQIEQLKRAGEKGRKTMRENGWKHLIEAARKNAKEKSKIVLQLDKEGNILREFASTVEADEFIHNGKRQNHIADVCNGKRKTDGGFKWMYKDNYFNNERRSA